MLIIEGLSAKEVSEQLGVAENMLYRWNQEHLDELEASKPAEAQSPKEMAEPSNHRCSATRSSGFLFSKPRIRVATQPTRSIVPTLSLQRCAPGCR